MASLNEISPDQGLLDVELRSFASSSEDIYVRPPADDPRMKTRLLTYVRQNYLKIIKILLTIMAALMIVVITCIIYVCLRPSTTVTTYCPMSDTSKVSFPSIVTSGQMKLVSELPPTSVPIGDDYAWGVDPCEAVECQDKECRPRTIKYEEMILYACCGCVPPSIHLKKYERDFLRNKVDLYFTVDYSISQLSKYDLLKLDKLKNLDGDWNLFRLSEETWVLVYEGISIPRKVNYI